MGMTEIAVPSGQPVTLLEKRDEVGPEGLTLRLRFVAPEIGKGSDFDATMEDMAHLCAAYGLDAADGEAGVPYRIIVSFSQEPVEFGVADSSIIQFFEIFSIEEGKCQVELF